MLEVVALVASIVAFLLSLVAFLGSGSEREEPPEAILGSQHASKGARREPPRPTSIPSSVREQGAKARKAEAEARIAEAVADKIEDPEGFARALVRSEKVDHEDLFDLDEDPRRDA